MSQEEATTEKECACNCECCKKECDCGQKEKRKHRHSSAMDNVSQVHVTDTVGAAFLGILAVLLLIFLVRANKRNRELLLEVIELRRQA
jgi:hypothetical protein